MRRLIVLRHGQTDWNDAGRFQGAADIDLNDAGRAQATRAAKALVDAGPVRIVASDLRRAFDTARPVAEAAGLEIDVDTRLRERAYGPWEGLTRDEIAARDPGPYKQWRARKPIDLEGVEPQGQVAERCAAGLAEAVAAAEGTVVVVTHGGASRHGIVRFLGWDDSVAEGLIGLGNCRWAELRHGGDAWRLYRYNANAEEQ